MQNSCIVAPHLWEPCLPLGKTGILLVQSFTTYEREVLPGCVSSLCLVGSVSFVHLKPSDFVSVFLLV